MGITSYKRIKIVRSSSLGHATAAPLMLVVMHIKRMPMMMRASFLLLASLFSGNLMADDLKNDFKYHSIRAYGSSIDVVADLEKHTITLRNLDINHELPIGRVKLEFPNECTVGIRKVTQANDGEISIYGSDYDEAIGTKITISYYDESSGATVKLESQYEEIWVAFVPQLLNIELK